MIPRVCFVFILLSPFILFPNILSYINLVLEQTPIPTLLLKSHPSKPASNPKVPNHSKLPPNQTKLKKKKKIKTSTNHPNPFYQQPRPIAMNHITNHHSKPNVKQKKKNPSSPTCQATVQPNSYIGDHWQAQLTTTMSQSTTCILTSTTQVDDLELPHTGESLSLVFVCRREVLQH